MGPLEGKTAIVTGGAGLIGAGVVAALSEAGASVAVVDIDRDAADALAHRVREGGRSAIAVHADLNERDACAVAVDQTVAEYGGLDVLVNLAQQFRGTFTPIIDTTDDDMFVSWSSGVLATFRMMQLSHPHLVARGGGAIVNFGSGGGTGASTGLLAYGSAKEGIRHLSRVAAKEWGPVGIRVNTICPFAHGPEKWESSHWLNDELLARIPLRRDGDPQRDIGAAIVYLAGPGDFVTGQTLFVDGGAASPI